MIGIRRWTVLAILAAIVSLPLTTLPAAAKYAAIVVDADTGKVLHAANADTRNHPASLTKMMTLYMLFDALEAGRLTLESPLKVSQHAAAAAPSKLGLRAGSTIKVEDAIQAIVTRSANDIAVVVAEALGKTEGKFAQAMTAKAHTLGMRRTTLKNASGLPNKAQFSSARDMAILARRLMTDFPQYYQYFGRTEFAYGRDIIRTHNNLLLSYEGADGIKTGYTAASGFNLVSSARRDSHRLIGVVFGGQSARTRDAHMVNLLDAGFAEMAGDMGALAAAPLLEDLESAQPLPKLAAADITGIGDIDTNETPERPQRLTLNELVAAPTVADPTRQWGIQVGAYGSRAKAAEAAATAKRRLSASYADTIERVEAAPWKDGKTLYRAQVIGLKQTETATACALAGIETKVGCKPVAVAVAKPARTAKTSAQKPAKKKAATRTAQR